MALTLAAKEATWIRLLLIKLGLLDKKDQYVEIKVSNMNKRANEIKIDVIKQEEGVIVLTSNPKVIDLIDNIEAKASTITNSILLKRDNQGSIALAYNPVFHSCTKYIDI